VRRLLAFACNDDDIKKAMNKCCSSSCSGASPIDVSTAAAQSQCLVDYGGFSSSYACVAGSGKSAVFPTYCNGSYAYSTNAMYVRATDTLCCPDTCHWTPEDLKTSEGENKCLNLESSGWTNWDCNGLSGRSAAVPSYCKTTNSNYKRAVPDNCCKDECAELAAAQTKSETEAQCLQSSGSSNWTYTSTFDCDGIEAGTKLASYTGYSRTAAAPGFCVSADADIKAAVNKCCPDSCKGINSKDDLPFDLDTAAGQSQCLVEYGGFSTSYACRARGGKSAVWPTYCNHSYKYSSNVKYVRAADTLCCPEDCTPTVDDLLTSYGENKCLNLESSGWTNWDCNGLEGRSAAVPSYCKTTNSNYKRAVPDHCCKDECDFLAAAENKSETETQCLNLGQPYQNWTGWDCEGIKAGTKLASYTGYTKKNAAPAFCKYTNGCEYEARVKSCCSEFCQADSPAEQYPQLAFDNDGHVIMKKDPATLPNISTVEGQSLCLQHYGVFSSSYACRAGSGKSAVWPTYCNGSYVYSTNVNYVRAADTLCCPTQCHWTQDDLLTSYGENKCLNLESSGWTNWDCNGLSGRSAAVPSYCKTTNSNYKRAVHDNCCRDECSSLEELETKSIKETQCLHDNSYGNWTGWDCEGIAAGSRLNSYTGWTRKAAAPGLQPHQQL